MTDPTPDEQLLSWREHAISTRTTFKEVHGLYAFIDLRWAYIALRSKRGLQPQHQAEIVRVAEDILHRASGHDAATAMDMLREHEQALTDWGVGVARAIERRGLTSGELERAAIAYAQRYFLMPDDAIAHVLTIPEERRYHWWEGDWVLPVSKS